MRRSINTENQNGKHVIDKPAKKPSHKSNREHRCAKLAVRRARRCGKTAPAPRRPTLYWAPAIAIRWL